MIATQLLPAAVLLALGGHAVADYGLQSSFVAEHKVRVLRRPAPGGGTVATPNPDWFVTLAAHCLIHGLAVACWMAAVLDLSGATAAQALAVGAWFGMAECAVHFAIDDAKGRERFSYRIDQALHYGCKLLWISVAASLAA